MMQAAMLQIVQSTCTGEISFPFVQLQPTFI